MALKPIYFPQSEAIACIVYDGRTKILGITFTNDRSYNYPGIPRDIYEGWLKHVRLGGSVSAYWREHIANIYDSIKVNA